MFHLGILNDHRVLRYRGNAFPGIAILNFEKRIVFCKMVGGDLDSSDIIERDYLEIDITTKIPEWWFG